MSLNQNLDDFVVRSIAGNGRNTVNQDPILRVQQRTPLIVSLGSGAVGSEVDAFGRLRVSNPHTLFDSSMEVDEQPLLWDESIAGSGGLAYNATESSVTLSTGGASSSIIRQSRQYMRYQPGKSLATLFTFVLGTRSPGVYRLVGYGDSNDGIFLQQVGGVLQEMTLDTSSGVFTQGSYFLLGSANDETIYYVWLDTVGDGVTGEPTPNINYVGVPVDISGGASEAEVATAVASAVDALDDFTAAPSTNVVTITNAAVGPSTISAGTLDTWNDDGTVSRAGVVSGLYWVLRSSTSGSPVDTSIEQAEWSLDVMDGTGTSTLTLTETEAQIGIIDIEWLGVGRVRCGFVINGQIYYTHTFDNYGVDKVYMQRASLPVRYEINADATGSDQSMTQICSTVLSEGGFVPRGMVRSFGTGITPIATGATALPIVAIRLRSGYERAFLLPLEMSLSNSSGGTNIIFVSLYVRATVTGGAWVQVSEAVEANITGASVAGGYRVTDAYVGRDANISITLTDTTLVPCADFAGVADEFVMVATAVSGTPSLSGSLIWREIF